MLADDGIMPVKQTVFTHMGLDVIFVQKPRTKEPVEKGGGRQTVTTEARCMYIYDGGEFMHNLITFQAGKLKEFLPLWRYITSDPTILQHVLGVKISLIEGIVSSQGTPRSSAFNAQQHNIVEKEIQTLLSKAPKSDGSSHMMFNFKQFNEFPERHHFKIDTLETVIRMMKRYMASVDLKDVYYPNQYTLRTRNIRNLHSKAPSTIILAYLLDSPVHQVFSQSY